MDTCSCNTWESSGEKTKAIIFQDRLVRWKCENSGNVRTRLKQRQYNHRININASKDTLSEKGANIRVRYKRIRSRIVSTLNMCILYSYPVPPTQTSRSLCYTFSSSQPRTANPTSAPFPLRP